MPCPTIDAATLLCPGPSLAKYDGRAIGAVFGVNRACVKRACDFAVCQDWPFVVKYWEQFCGTPRLITRDESLVEVRKRLKIGDDRIGPLWQELVYWAMPDVSWRLCSATTALAAAAMLGAKTIICHGVDMVGELDWDGVKAGEYRTEARWKREAEVWAKMIGWLNKRGCEVLCGNN